MHGCDGNPGMGAIRASSTGPVFTTRMRLRTVTENEHAPCETTIRSHPGIKVDDCGISDDRYLLRSASLPPAARVGGHVQRPSTRKLRRAPRTRRSMPNINGTCIDHVNEERGRENKIYGSSVKSCNVRQTLPQKMSPPVGQHSRFSGFHISRLKQLGLKQVRARLKALICCYPAIFNMVRVATLLYRY